MSYKRSRTNFENDNGSQYQPPFVAYGTALPPLDSEARDDGSYVPLWKQEVRDERGRKRLHGAFTGGFSAGYFNTVGSKDGWAPSTFVSSRSDRRRDGQVSAAQKTAEDFMDEEDLADAAEAQKLETQSSFAGLGSTQDDGNRRGFVTDLFKTAGDTMGVKLLQRMGWRQGQGVGPRVRRKVRDGGDGENDDDPKQSTHLFAPDDSRMISFNRKTDRFGLGYAGENRLGQDTGVRGGAVRAGDGEEDEDAEGGRLFQMRKPPKAKSKPKQTGLGVGVLNDTGSDDEDPYEIGPKISYNRIIGGDKRKKKGGLVANTTSSVSKFTINSRRLAHQSSSSGFRRCHDGRLPLDGFTLASHSLSTDQENKHPPPTVPQGWKPAKSSRFDVRPNDPNSFQSTTDTARASSLDPSQRAALLGESALPGKSIFDYISSKTRDRLATATNRANLPQGKGESAPAGYERSPTERAKSLWDLVPRLHPSLATAALQRGSSGWMPYAEDANKRARYRNYLESMTGARNDLPDRPSGSSTDEWVTEMREFAHAAQVFKPISGLMATRFTSASGPPALASDSSASEGKENTQAAAVKAEDPAEQAAKVGMFGPMTRTREDFWPTRLTCKRFNVKPPAHVLAEPAGGKADGKSRGPAARTDVLGKETLDHMMKEAHLASASTSLAKAEGADGEVQVPARRMVEEVDVERNEAIEGERAGEAVFKAVFGSDDEDD